MQSADNYSIVIINMDDHNYPCFREMNMNVTNESEDEEEEKIERKCSR